MRQKATLAFAAIILAAFSWGCHSGKFKTSPLSPKNVVVSAALENYENDIEQVKREKIQRNVMIEARNIQLPLLAGPTEPVNPRIYKFHVWAFHPTLTSTQSLSETFTNQLQVEVLGVPAAIRPLSYNEASQLPNYPILTSRSVVEIAVNSTNIDKSFEIMAWYPSNYEAFEQARYKRLEDLRRQVAELEAQKTNTSASRNLQQDHAGHQKAAEARRREANRARERLTKAEEELHRRENERAAGAAARAFQTSSLHQLTEDRQRSEHERAENENRLLTIRGELEEAESAVRNLDHILEKERQAGASSSRMLRLSDRRRRAQTAADTVAAEEALAQAYLARTLAAQETLETQAAATRRAMEESERQVQSAAEKLTESKNAAAEARKEFEALQQEQSAPTPPAPPAPGTDKDLSSLKEIYAETLAEKDKINPWGHRVDVKVYNGDLRTQIQLASQEEVEHNFGPQFAKFFHVGRIFLRNENANKQLVVFTTSLRARTLFYRSPDKDLAKALAKAAERETNSVAQFDLLKARINSLLRNRPETTTGLDREDLRQLYAVTRARPSDSDDTIVGEALPNLPSESRLEALRIVGYAKDRIKEGNDFVEKRIMDLANQKNLPSRQKDVVRRWVGQELQLGGGLITARAFPANSDLGTLAEEFATAAQAYAQTQDQTNRQQVEDRFLVNSTPFDLSTPILVNAGNKSLVSSARARRQAQLASHGYIWEDYYRPMTFQGVLNSLLVVTESSVRAQVMRWLETAGIVAGGVVGLGSIFNEVTTRSYIEAVAVTTSIILPEARKLLRDDVDKYIKNLGNMAMDTVAVVPPSGVADRYIFFPRGPIFGNGVSEFSIDAPSYIVEIDNNDVAVQAMLIEQGQTIQAGVLSARDLVAGALDEGKAQRDADQAKLINMTENLRRFRLTTLPGEIDEFIKHNNTNGAVELVRSYRSVFGTDSSGVLDKAIAKHNLPVGGMRGAAPTLTPASLTTNLAAGATEKISFTLDDADTAPIYITASAASSQTNLISALTISGEGRQRSLEITAREAVAGEAEIVLTIGDPTGNSAPFKWKATVAPTNSAPRLNLSPTNVVMLGGQSSNVLQLTITDPDQNEEFTLSAVPVLTNLFTIDFLPLLSPQTNRQLTIRIAVTDTPSTNTITIKAEDKGKVIGTSAFQLTVTKNAPAE